MNVRCLIDKLIDRKVTDGFEFPLGAYPIEAMAPRQGYTLAFESADADEPPPTEGGGLVGDSYLGGADAGGSGGSGRGDDDGPGGPDGEFEQWPDRYVFDVVISHRRIESLTRALWALLPGRVYPIVDVLGVDAFREIDPYVAYELVGIERFLEGVRQYRPYLMEDGLVGFGAMSESPFLYIFIDEHKIVTIRVEAELKEKVEKILAAFDLEPVDQIAGADAAAHEHRGVLEVPPDRSDVLNADEIIEVLRDQWGLTLNVDPTRNVDDSGSDIGITGWRCVVRMIEPTGGLKYAEVLLTAGSLADAENLSAEAAQAMYEDDLEREENEPAALDPARQADEPAAPAAPPTSPPPRSIRSSAPSTSKAKPVETGDEGLSASLGGPDAADAEDPTAPTSDDEPPIEVDVLAADRFKEPEFREIVAKARGEALASRKTKGPRPKFPPVTFQESRIFAGRWME